MPRRRMETGAQPSTGFEKQHLTAPTRTAIGRRPAQTVIVKRVQRFKILARALGLAGLHGPAVQRRIGKSPRMTAAEWRRAKDKCRSIGRIKREIAMSPSKWPRSSVRDAWIRASSIGPSQHRKKPQLPAMLRKRVNWRRCRRKAATFTLDTSILTKPLSQRVALSLSDFFVKRASGSRRTRRGPRCQRS